MYSESPQIDAIRDMGAGRGTIEMLMRHGGDLEALRPWRSLVNGRTYITRTVKNSKGESVRKNFEVQNSGFSDFTKDDWTLIDRESLRVAKPEMLIASDIERSGLTRPIQNWMGKSVFQYQRMTDITPATISMDGRRRGLADNPVHDMDSTPLPLIHKDLDFSARQVLISRNGGDGIDMDSLSEAGVRCYELLEMLTLGTTTFNKFSGGRIWGLKNFPNRIVYPTMTAPTTSNQAVTVAEVNHMRQLALTQFQRGPFVLYYALPWDEFMMGDYNLYLGRTLLQRLEQIVGVGNVRLADFMHTGLSMLMVQQNVKTVRMLSGGELITVQWQSGDGMSYHLKTILTKVPQVRCDSNGNSGIVHGYPAGRADT